MNFNQLAIFVRVVDSGSFTKAAQLLHQPKSRVSRQIAALEQELNTSLLYRTTRQFSLTEAGRTLYEKARHHIYEMEKVAEALGSETEKVSGVLRVSAPEDVGSSILSPVLEEFLEKYPRLTLDLSVTNRLVDLVKEGVDVALRIGKLTDKSLKTRKLGHIALVLVASPQYLSRAPKLQTLSDLENHAALSFAVGPDPRTWEFRTGTKVSPKFRASSTHPQIILNLALSGQGIALLPEFLCLDGLQNGQLTRLFRQHSTTPIPIQFVWPAQHETSLKVRTFVDLMVEKLGRYF